VNLKQDSINHVVFCRVRIDIYIFVLKIFYEGVAELWQINKENKKVWLADGNLWRQLRSLELVPALHLLKERFKLLPRQ
jgi:hypothetical protein